VHSDWER